jgi:hypothetical protein
LQLLKHYRSHERRGDVPGISAAAPRRRRNADSGADELKEEAEEGGDEAKTLVCDMCAGVFGSEKALSLHLSAHKQAGLRITAEKKNIFFYLSKTTIYLSLGLHKERPSYGRSHQLSKEAIQHFKT